jgi:hypothetical protein
VRAAVGHDAVMAAKRTSIKKAATKTKKRAKKAASAGKATVAKVKRVVKKASGAAKAKKKAAASTMERVRSKAKKLVEKVEHAGHEASDVAVRIGSTMETIGSAIVSMIKPDAAAPQK